MKILLLCVALLQASLYHQVSCRSGGAPAGACSNLSPDPAQHGAPPQTSAVPYSIDLSPFCSNGTYSYYPGREYTLSLSGENNMPQFRGVLVQGRLMSDDTTPAGTFTVNAASMDDTRLSDCTPSNSAITHSNRNDKSSVYFNWTAPAEGTGTLRFGFAVVQTRMMYWADQRSMVVAEAGSGEEGSACTVVTTEEPATTAGASQPTVESVTTAGASQLTSVGFSTLLIATLLMAIKIAL